MGEPLIQIVNEDDEPIGGATRQEAQQNGLIHRIVQAMVEDTEGRLLLQKRGGVRLYPNHWDTSVGGHVDEGEDYLEAVQRETQEEIGIQGVEFQELGRYRKDRTTEEGRHIKRFYRVFRIVVPEGTALNIDPEEVAEVRWMTLDAAKELVENPSEQTTPSLKEALDRFYTYENHSHQAAS